VNALLLTVFISEGFANKDKIYDKLTSFKSFRAVMYGSSITAGCKWNTKLWRLGIRNSGTNGYTSAHLVWFIHKKVIRYKPEFCFIEAGINDINTGIPLSKISQNIEIIVDTLMKNKINPVLQSTLYINRENDKIINQQIDSLNAILKKIAYNKNITYLDVNKYLSKNNKLEIKYTTDGTHLNSSAYNIWINEIEKILMTKEIE
jgi:lysophospholipase L1-like esterase